MKVATLKLRGPAPGGATHFQFYDDELASSGLHATQLAILMVLQRVDGTSVNAMAEGLALDRTTAGKNLRPLEQAGFIAVAPSRQDGRRRVVRSPPPALSALQFGQP